MTRLATVVLALALALALAGPASADSSYFQLKGGIYTPQDDTLKDLNFNSGGSFEASLAYDIERAFGVELGVGYFGTRNDATPETRFQVVPVSVTAKGIYPVDPFELYAGAGLSANLVDVKTDGAGGRSAHDTAFGYHAVVGARADVNKKLFVGIEGKYLWVKPAFEGWSPKLNGFDTSLVVGYRFE